MDRVVLFGLRSELGPMVTAMMCQKSAHREEELSD